MAIPTNVPRNHLSVFVLAIGFLTLTLGLGMTGQFVFLYMEKVLGLSIAAIYGAIYGCIFSLLLVFIFIPALPPIMGWASDKVGRKKMIVPAFFIYSLTVLLYPSILFFPYIYYVLIAGILSSMYRPASNAFIADAVRTQRRGMIFGVFSAITMSASIVAPSLGWATVNSLGFPALFSIGATLILLGAVLCLLLLRESKELESIETSDLKSNGSQDKNGNAGILQGDYRKNKLTANLKFDSTGNWRGVAAILITISFLLTFLLYPAEMALLLTASLDGSSISLISDFFSWLNLLGVISVVLGGVLADLFGRKKTLLGVFAFTVGSGLVVSLVVYVTSSLLFLLVMISIIAFTSTVISPIVLALIADVTPRSRRGLTYGFLVLGNSLSTVVLNTVVLDAILPMRLAGIMVLFVIAISLTILATILLILGVKETRS